MGPRAANGTIGKTPRCSATLRRHDRTIVDQQLNPDFERRSFWQATMPALPDRSGRPLPDVADVVVVGGGYTGINAARELARRGVAVTLLEAETLGFGASTRNGGIVHAGYKWGPRELIGRYGDETGRALYRDTLDGYETVKRLIADEAIDCDFREVGHLELAYAPSHVRELRARPPGPGLRGRRFAARAARGAARRDRLGCLLRGPGRRRRAVCSTRDATSRARRGRRSRRRRPPRARPGALDPAPGGRSVRGRDGARGDPRPATCSSPRTATRTAWRRPLRRRIIPIGSYIIASEPLPEALARELSPSGRSFFDTKNFLYYWHVSADRRMVFGGRASFMPTSIERTARDPPPRPARGPPAAGRLPDRLRLGRQRRLHLRPDAARRPDAGRRGLRDGLLRDGRGPDDAPRDEGRGVAGRRRAAGAEPADRSRWCRRRTRAGRGSCRSSASGSGSRTGWRPAREADRPGAAASPAAGRCRPRSPGS